MARIRTIKPEFTTSAQVVECSRDARLLFILMWMFCDDYGIHPANVKQLKMECFPGDDVSSADVQSMIDELINSGLLLHYSADGAEYWKVTGWKHQRIDKRQPGKYPHEGGKIPVADASDSTTIPGAFQERSTNGTGTLPERSKTIPRPFPPERKGKERKGKDTKGEEKINKHSLLGSGDEQIPGTVPVKKTSRGNPELAERKRAARAEIAAEVEGEALPERPSRPEPKVRTIPDHDDEDGPEFEAKKRALIAEMKADLAREVGRG